jgi:hypothetical protein
MRLLFAAVLLFVTATAAFAQREPEIVVPGKAGVPVYINGIDASWGIVEGEFGLDRPNQIAPTVIWRPALIPQPYGVPGYYPADDRRPGYGRLEIAPPANRRLPPPAPTFYRYWSSESAATPATDPQSIQPMPMIVEPNVNLGRQYGGGNRPGGDPMPR